jgi:hypothetical protein
MEDRNQEKGSRRNGINRRKGKEKKEERFLDKKWS